MTQIFINFIGKHLQYLQYVRVNGVTQALDFIMEIHNIYLGL